MDRHESVRARPAVPLDGLDPGPAVVQFRAQRGRFDRRHQPAAAAMIAAITAGRSPDDIFR